MRTTRSLVAAGAAATLLLAAACSSDTPTADSSNSSSSSSAEETSSSAEETSSSAEETSASEEPSESEEPPASGGSDNEWFEQAAYDNQLRWLEATPEGDAATPWLQAIEPDWVDTAAFKADGPQNLCFSNASNDNPWRATGLVTFNSQVEVLQGEGVIGEYFYSDAGGSDEQQITDIQKFISDGNCGAIVISPATSATLTPAVEAACASGLPIIVFDRGVNTDCQVTFIHAVGGYAYGAEGANFLVDNLEAGSRVLALRILPGVDVLEHRWAAAEQIFAESDLEVVGVEFTDGDGAKIKSIIASYLERGDIDGVWTDAGDGILSAIEAFEDAGKDYPLAVGEDELTFLRAWQEKDFTGVGLVYSNFQWRTAVLAAQKIWAGEEVPSEWVLPQVSVKTPEERDEILTKYADMPNLFYASFGGEDLPAYPAGYQG